jgi:polysaccharide export outer membrane protein
LLSEVFESLSPRTLKENKEREMKKFKELVTVGIIGLAIIFISAPVAYSQADKEILLKKEAQAEVAADSDSYVIGSEDVLYIHVWGEETTLSKQVTVRMDGKISMPLVDDIQATGLTPLQLKGKLTERLKDFVEAPNVTVIVMEANSFKVYISGQVKTPGVLRLRTETSLAQAISMVGGLTEWANQSKIIVIRKEDGKEKQFTINYKKIINGKDLKSNIILKAGDTIIVP